MTSNRNSRSLRARSAGPNLHLKAGSWGRRILRTIEVPTGMGRMKEFYLHATKGWKPFNPYAAGMIERGGK